ncbi:MAG: putative monovalent cation/H+ antiporter subunit A [Rhizobiaceae bacterium]|jgi:multicomponent Na+:H+ antiporter subunit A|nr:putative monovalent cation/H+ antiporter subunit A [Rhizobiaceae bacterium]
MSLTFFAFFAPFLAALAAPVLVRRMGAAAGWVLAVVPALLFVHWWGFLPEVAAGERITGGYRWIPSLNVNFSWFIDGLSLTFALLITGIGTLIVIYAGAYLKGYPTQGRFLSFILMFMGAMQGLVLADSFLMLFVFWELTSITSFLLIGFDHKREAARRAALQALVVTGLGGLVLLAGLIVIWNITGVSEMSLLLATGDTLRQSPFYLLALVLVLGGAFTKSAQFPLHFWLPNAMEAPTPVSAYLHSATMVKAGVYLLMRLNPAMGDTAAWATILPLFGGVTLAVGAFLAIRQTDLKLMLAYTTVASLGLLVMLTGVGTEKALAAAALYLVAHSLFKGALFMVAGAIDHEAGTRDLTKLSGLRKAMPVTFTAGLLAALSMAGLTPFYGFIAKEEIYYALSGTWPAHAMLLIVAVLANALMFAVAFAVGLKPFIGAPVETPKHAHDGPVGLLAGPLLLAVTGLAAGIVWPLAHSLFADPAATAIAGQPITIKTGIVPHWNAAFMLSLVTVALGIAFYVGLGRLRAIADRVVTGIGWGPDQGFDQFTRGLLGLSVATTRFSQSGRLETYMTVTFASLAAVLLLPMILGDELPGVPAFPQARFFDWAMVLIAAVGIIAVVWAKNRLTAIVSLGIQGFAVAVIFMLNGAPDLSFTQFMIETLSVVILALVMTRLSLTPSDHRPTGSKVIDLVIALAVGAGFTLLLLKVLERPLDPTLATFFADFSGTVAFGRNIVNVILVDFRGVDTLGEIGVVMIAGLAILALIRIRVSAAGNRREMREAK